MTTEQSTASREKRARKAAYEEGLMVVKSRRRDPAHEDYGLYVLVDDTAGNRHRPWGGQAAWREFHDGHGMTLDQVEADLKVYAAQSAERAARFNAA